MEQKALKKAQLNKETGDAKGVTAPNRSVTEGRTTWPQGAEQRDPGEEVLRQRISEWMARGLLPYYKLGRTVRFNWDEVKAHLAQTYRWLCRNRRVA